MSGRRTSRELASAMSMRYPSTLSFMSSMYTDETQNKQKEIVSSSPRRNMYSQLVQDKRAITDEYHELHRSVNKLYRQIEKDKGRLRDLENALEPCGRETYTVKYMDCEEITSRSRQVTRANRDLELASDQREYVEQMVSEPMLKQLKLDVSKEWEEIRRIRDKMKKTVVEIDSIGRQIQEKRESRIRNGIEEQEKVIKTLEIQISTMKQRKKKLEKWVSVEEQRKIHMDRETANLEFRLAEIVAHNQKLEARYVKLLLKQRTERDSAEMLISKLNQNKETKKRVCG